MTLCRYPSILGGMQPSKRRLRLQLRASNLAAPAGSSFWSAPVVLDALGGASVVSVPCPLARIGVTSPAVMLLAIAALQVRQREVLHQSKLCCDCCSDVQRRLQGSIYQASTSLKG